jgi:hypothetical protein
MAIAELAAKPVIAGSGCNFQRHCAWAIFLGIGFKFNDFIQAMAPHQRFGQTAPVPDRPDLHRGRARGEAALLERSGSGTTSRPRSCRRSSASTASANGDGGAWRARWASSAQEVAGERGFSCINNDCVVETRAHGGRQRRPDRHLIPFATQYEYTPSYNDFGHTDDDAHFWRADGLPDPRPAAGAEARPQRRHPRQGPDRAGRHDRPGLPDVSPFHADCIARFRKHGFAFLGMKTITTDVVRENNQTYRLGWTEQCKDGTRMGCGHAGIPAALPQAADRPATAMPTSRW